MTAALLLSVLVAAVVTRVTLHLWVHWRRRQHLFQRLRQEPPSGSGTPGREPRVGLPFLPVLAVAGACLIAVTLGMPHARRLLRWLPLGAGLSIAVTAALRRNRRQLREQALIADLPTFIELVALCVRGGVSLDESIREAARQHAGPAGRFFRALLLTSEGGTGLSSVLKHAADDAPAQEMRSVCQTLASALLLGVSASETLSELSGYAARRRRQLAEEKIRTIPLKLTMVTLLLLLPPVVALVVLPNVAAFLQTPW